MNYGLYVSASALSTTMAKQDVLANNLANVTTAGFKPDKFAIRQRDVARVEDGLPFLPSNALLERLGAGVMPMPTSVDVTPAALESTSRPLDLAIEGDGFFVVSAGPGSDGLRLTRDGRLAIGPGGTLVTANEGRPVLGDDGGPIAVRTDLPVRVDADGTVSQGNEAVGRLRVVVPPDPRTLVKVGANLLRLPRGEAGALRDAAGAVRQGMVESSGVDAIRAMIGVTNASRSANSLTNMIGYYNDLMGRAINSFARVA